MNTFIRITASGIFALTLSSCTESSELDAAVNKIKNIADFQYEHIGAKWSQSFNVENGCEVSLILEVVEINDLEIFNSAMVNRYDEKTTLNFDAKQENIGSIIIETVSNYPGLEDVKMVVIEGVTSESLAATGTIEMVEIEPGFCQKWYDVDSVRCIEERNGGKTVPIHVRPSEAIRSDADIIEAFQSLISACQE
ncbi:hypothetical protein V6617_01320 [Pelagibacterium nitratireducens]|uniref:Lipoprotein n=1 Tax=Pelagibacterium nitratireducens TaxID=1046114 RepID=A0ABZ2I6J9_9HYPH